MKKVTGTRQGDNPGLIISFSETAILRASTLSPKSAIVDFEEVLFSMKPPKEMGPLSLDMFW